MRAGTVYGDLEEMKKDMTPLIQYAIEPKIRGTEIIIEKTNKDTKPLRIHADKKIILEENAIKELQALTINKTYSLDATLTEEGKIYVHDITMYDNNSVTDLNWRERKKLREQLAYKQNGDVIEIPSAEIIPQDTYTTHATRCTTHPHSTGCIIKNMAATYSSGTTAHYSAYDLGISGEGSGMTNPLPSPLNPGNDKVSGMPINSNPIPTPLSETKEKKMEIERK